MKTLVESVQDLKAFEESAQHKSRITKAFVITLIASSVLFCVAFYFGFNGSSGMMIGLWFVGFVAFMLSPLTLRDRAEVIREDLEWHVETSSLNAIQKRYNIADDQIVSLRKKENPSNALLPVVSFTYYDFDFNRCYELDFSFDENLEPVILKSYPDDQALIERLKNA